MNDYTPIYIVIYLVGIVISFNVITSKLKEKFPKLDYHLELKFAVMALSCFSFLALYFILTNEELNS